MALDSIFLCIYVVEAVLKIIALGLKYFSDSWNNLGEGMGPTHVQWEPLKPSGLPRTNGHRGIG